MAAVLGLTAIVVVAAVLLVAGVRKNAQIDSLKAHPVPVDLTVTHCLGLMGGSGSNAAGYECTGTYTFAGRHFIEGVPGLVFHPAGSTVHGIVSDSDPGVVLHDADGGERTCVAGQGAAAGVGTGGDPRMRCVAPGAAPEAPSRGDPPERRGDRSVGRGTVTHGR